MKRRTVIVLLAVLLALGCGALGVAASSGSGQVGIAFYEQSGGNGGGSGGTGSSPDPPTGSFAVEDRDNLVTILDPQVSAADLGDLPKTGSDRRVSLLLLSAGAGLIVFQLFTDRQDERNIA